MPRRNHNAVQRGTRLPRVTHLLIDTHNGNRQVSAGSKRDLLVQADIANAEVHSWRYRVVPIHR